MKKLSFIAPLLFWSCSKNPDIFPEPRDFAHLVVGNYWIYERYEDDGSGKLTFLAGYDSTYVEKDTVIGGQIFKKLVEQYDTNRLISFLRVHDDQLVDKDRNIMFSQNDFQTIFRTENWTSGNQSLYSVETQMYDKNFELQTPAGHFVTSALRQKYRVNPVFAKGSDTVKFAFTRYSSQVGMVSKTLEIYINRNTRLEKRLLRYHIQR